MDSNCLIDASGKGYHLYDGIGVEERDKEVVANDEPIMGIKFFFPQINRLLWRNLEMNGMASRQETDSQNMMESCLNKWLSISQAASWIFLHLVLNGPFLGGLKVLQLLRPLKLMQKELPRARNTLGRILKELKREVRKQTASY